MQWRYNVNKTSQKLKDKYDDNIEIDFIGGFL